MKNWRWWFGSVNVTDDDVTVLELRDPPHMNCTPVFPGRNPIVDDAEWAELELWLGRT